MTDRASMEISAAAGAAMNGGNAMRYIMSSALKLLLKRDFDKKQVPINCWQSEATIPI
ncbi:MAG TPA: hypothetical protein VLM36_02600 [Sphingomicrobium sp.]|nr:hypothetical protein [Sphingomicrobium sp.]